MDTRPVFFDGGEGATVNSRWQIQYRLEYSTTQARDGTHSLKLPNDPNAQYGSTYASCPAVDGPYRVSAWVYDDMSSFYAFGAALVGIYAPGSGSTAVGINCGVDGNNYYISGGLWNESTSIPRTLGWHLLEMTNWRNGTFSAWIDGVIVADHRTQLSGTMASVALWTAGTTAHDQFFDDFTISQHVVEDDAEGTQSPVQHGWQSLYGPGGLSYSASQAHSGTKSLLTAGGVAVYGQYAVTKNLTMDCWIYDDGGINYNVVCLGNPLVGPTVSIGINLGVNPGGAYYAGSHLGAFNVGTGRSVGWHHAQIYINATQTQALIRWDGVTYGPITTDFSGMTDHVVLYNVTGESNFVDDIEVYAGLPDQHTPLFTDNADYGTPVGNGWLNWRDTNPASGLTYYPTNFAKSGSRVLAVGNSFGAPWGATRPVNGASFPITCEVDFYDGGLYNAFVQFDSCRTVGQVFGVGYIPSQSGSFYVYYMGTDVGGTWTPTTIPVAHGWHHVNITYLNASYVVLAIDGHVEFAGAIPDAATASNLAVSFHTGNEANFWTDNWDVYELANTTIFEDDAEEANDPMTLWTRDAWQPWGGSLSYSADHAKGGSKSIQVVGPVHCVDLFYHPFPNLTSWDGITFDAWFFDSMNLDGNGDNPSCGIGCGMMSDQNTRVNLWFHAANDTVYKYWIGLTTFGTAVNRSRGWHRLQIHFDEDGANGIIAIDGVQVFYGTLPRPAQRSVWLVGYERTNYFDNVRVYVGDPEFVEYIFEDDAESGRVQDNWLFINNAGTGAIAYEPDRSVEGNRSISMTATYFNYCQEHFLSDVTDKTCQFWFYDDGHTATGYGPGIWVGTGRFGDQDSTWVGTSQAGSTPSATNYNFHRDPSPSGFFEDTGVIRSIGWHVVQIYYDSGAGNGRILIDNREVYTGTLNKPTRGYNFAQPCLWITTLNGGGQQPGSFEGYFDDIEVYSGQPRAEALPGGLIRDLVAYYQENVPMGQIDVLGNYDLNTVFGAPAFDASGKLSGCYDYSVTDAASTAITGSPSWLQGTVSCWMYPTSYSNIGKAFIWFPGTTNWGSIGILEDNVYATHGIRLHCGFSGTDESIYPTLPALNAWHHVVFAWDGASDKIFLWVDGVKQETTLSVPHSGWSPMDGSFQLGNALSPNTSASAKFDEIGVWSRLLSDTEVSNLYSNGNGVTYPFTGGGGGTGLTSGQTAYYTCDEASGNLIDTLGNHNIPMLNTVGSVPGKISTARGVFSAVDRFETTSFPSFDTEQPVTVNCWAKWNGTTIPYGVIFGAMSGVPGAMIFVGYLSNSNFLTYIGVNGGNAQTPTGNALPVNQWTMLTISYSGASRQLKMYQNGAQIVSTPVTMIPSSTPTLGFNVGSNGGQYFPGSIDELGLWARVLSDEEVNQLYNNGAGMTYPFVAPPPNLPPIATVPVLNPAVPLVGHNVIGTSTYTDPEGQAGTLTFNWLLNDVNIRTAIVNVNSGASGSDTLPAQILGATVFEDNAETGSQPSDNGWIPDASTSYSSALAHTGTRSILLGGGNYLGYVHKVINIVGNTFEAWIYDDLFHTTFSYGYQTMTVQQSNTNAIMAIGISEPGTGTGATHYQAYTGGYIDTGVPRTLGWHKVSITGYLDNTFDMRIDDVIVLSGTTPVLEQPVRLSLNSHRYETTTDFNGYWDDVKVYAGPPGGIQLRAGDSLECQVTPNDGVQDGSFAEVYATIHAKPTATEAVFNPSPPLMGSDIVATSTYNNVEAVSGSLQFTWKVNGTTKKTQTVGSSPGLTTDLLATYTFDELSGNLIDADGTGHDLALVGNCPSVPGKIQGTRGPLNWNNYFQGAFPQISIRQDLTMSFWLKIPASAYNPYVVCLGNNFTGPLAMYWALNNNDQRFGVGVQNNYNPAAGFGVTSLTAFPRDTWKFLTARWTASTKTLEYFIDGVSQGTMSQPLVSDETYTPELWIGRIPNVDGQGSLLDAFNLWTRALSNAEILGLYNGGAGKEYPFGLAPGDSAQSTLTYEADLNEVFEDDAETGSIADRWNVFFQFDNGCSYSSTRVHTGNRSIEVNGGIRKDMTPLGGLAGKYYNAWIWDDMIPYGSASYYPRILNIGSWGDGYQLYIGTQSAATDGAWSNTNYVMYANDGNRPLNSGVTRTLGWHKFGIYLHSNGTDYEYFIDDVQVHTGTLVWGFNGGTNLTLAAYDASQSATPGFFDDIEVYDGVPGGHNFFANDTVRCEVVPISSVPVTGDMVAHEEVALGTPSIGSFTFDHAGSLSGERLLGHLITLSYVYLDPQGRHGSFTHTWKVNGITVHTDTDSGAPGATLYGTFEPMLFNYGDIITVDIDGTAGVEVLPTTTLTLIVEDNATPGPGGLKFEVTTTKRG